MKILKPGKVEQRKFTCEKCGCVFSASKSEINTDIDLYVCPQDGCHYCAIRWEDGEPYEEPVQDTRTDRERLYGILLTVNPIATTAELVDLLTANGVTFRED